MGYKSLKPADATVKKPGYVKAWVNILSDFTTLQVPTLGETPAVGDKYKITTDHVWALGKGAMTCMADPEVLEASGESVGEKGSLNMKYMPKIFIPGDGPAMQEVVDSIANEGLVIFMQNTCEADSKVYQYGGGCVPCKVTKVGFGSGTFVSGKVGWTLEIAAYDRYFYEGDITERA